MDRNFYDFPLFVNTTTLTIQVIGQIRKDIQEKTGYDNKKKVCIPFIEGKGYVDEAGQIWIYVKQKPEHRKNVLPYFWLKQNGKKGFNNPSESILSDFSIDKATDLSLDRIQKNSDPDKVYYNSKDMESINKTSKNYIPVINPDDDFLKKIVKKIILEKGINVMSLKDKLDKPWLLPNMITALDKQTKMSTLYFTYWSEVLHFKYDIRIFHDDNTMENDEYPLEKPLIYRSRSWGGDGADNVQDLEEFLRKEEEE